MADYYFLGLWQERVRLKKESKSKQSVFGIMGKSPLLDIPKFHIVYDAPTDPLHRDHLGVTKATWRLTTNQAKQSLGGQMHRKWLTMSAKTIRQYGCLVSLVTDQEQVPFFKGHEWKALVLTAFPSIVRHTTDLQDKETGRLWAIYAFLLRSYTVNDEMFARTDHVYLRTLHKEFYELYNTVFGPEHMTFNVHAHYHMDINRASGRQHLISTEPFESMYGDIKKSFAPGTTSIGKQFLHKILMKYLDHKENQCKYRIMIKDTPPNLRRDDSLLTDTKWKFYKVSYLSRDSEDIEVTPIKTEKWVCPQATDLPFQKVGVLNLLNTMKTL